MEEVKRFGAKVVEEHGLKWFNIQKEAKYAPENWIDEGRLTFEFPTISDTVHELGQGYVFPEPEECNLTLVRKFYENWNTSYGESTNIKVQDQVVRFTTRSYNVFLGTPVVDLEMYFLFLEKSPYRDIFHTLCGEYSNCSVGK
ncbi:hypothetical protein HAX54_024989, partial [Datura stramonium]|nr:hypothetical protein [Datura stramonium]